MFFFQIQRKEVCKLGDKLLHFFLFKTFFFLLFCEIEKEEKKVQVI